MRREIWHLAIHYWPNAAIAGVKPVEATFTQILQDPDDPSLYKVHDFWFTEPPSKDDFLAMCGRIPWTSVWEFTLFPCLTSWPFVSITQQRNDVELLDSTGRSVGRVVVSREDLYDAEGYDRWKEIEAEKPKKRRKSCTKKS